MPESSSSSSSALKPSSKAGLPLIELRKKGIIEEEPERYSPKSWIFAAKHCAEEAAQFEDQGKLEDAFVAYLRALGCFESFTRHKEYPTIKAQSPSHHVWKSVVDFQEKRQVYIDKAKGLAEVLKERDVEKGVVERKEMNGHVDKPPKPLPHINKLVKPPPSQPQSQARTTSTQPTRPPSPPPSSSSTVTPSTASSAQTFNTATGPSPISPSNGSSSAQPDVSNGGSIAARLAALRGAGMHVGAGGSDNNGGGVGFGGSGMAGVGTGGSGGPRRDSTASITQPFSAGKLDNNKTGSSINSIRSVSGGTADKNGSGSGSGSGQQYGSAYAAYRERHGSGPPTPILSPDPSGQFASGSGNPADGYMSALAANHSGHEKQSSPGPSSSIRPLPSVPSHHHKSSLPNLPTSTSQSGYNSNSAASSNGNNRSRHGTLSNGSNVPPPIQEDELAHFSSAFPSLTEFEDNPDFAGSGMSSVDRKPVDLPPPRAGFGGSRHLGGGGPPPRSPLGEDDGFSFPTMPSPPRHKPGQLSSNVPSKLDMPEPKPSSAVKPALPSPRFGFASGSGLSVADIPPRPSSLPLADTENVPDPSYFPSPPLPSQTASKQTLTATAPPPKPKTKPSLPFGNSITAAKLFDYLSNTSLWILIVDTRSREEYERDWVGKGIDMGEGRSPRVIWVDPTVLKRAGMTSTKLEDSLALSPPSDQKAFADRAKADLVVIYDDASTDFPAKGSPPTAPSALFSIIYENEFSKTLKRTPVLLVGGFRAWKGETERGRVGRPPVPTKKPSLGVPAMDASQDASRANRRETQVYRAAPPSTSSYSRNITENFGAPHPQSMAGSSSGYGGRPLAPSAAAGPSSYQSKYNSGSNGGPAMPPAASLSPGRLTRKSSDYAEHGTASYAGYSAHAPRSSLDYGRTDPSAPTPPPMAASPPTARQDNRPAPPRRSSTITFDNLTRLPAGQDMLYWNEVALGISGLKNLGNTCYMNSTLQCLSATYPLARFFRDGSFRKAINVNNPLGTKGDLARAFATLISMLWEESFTFLSPVTFRKSISQFAPQFAGTDQHDSQEFLSFLLDGLHEDLSRVQVRPPPVEMTPEREAALETLPPAIAAEKEWRIYKQRNDSLIVDLFQGQYRNRMECLTCHQTSTTYDSFMYLSLPVPHGKKAVVLQELIDEFVKTEVLSGADAWNCPRCKVPRKASKSLSIARLPPVLLVHLKRFSTKDGHFWDKSETPVVFPVRNLDMTHYLPPAPVGRGGNVVGPGDDPMSQNGPFRFDLFAVSNHMGSLSNGHYTAFVNSSTGWQYCDDSKITHSSERDVVTKPAYILFYKRVINQ